MASEAVKKILEAEAEADNKTAETRKRAEEIVSEAERKAAIAIQKRITDASSDAGKLREENRKKLAEYTLKAEETCSASLSDIDKMAAENSDKAVKAIINGYFS